MTLTLATQGIRRYRDTVYCMTPESFDEAKAELELIGYGDSPFTIERHTYGLTPEQIAIGDAEGWSGRLQTADVGKCGTCKRYISRLGIQTHGHTCELCGAVTFYELVPGSRIRFEFTAEPYRGNFKSEVWMTVHEWDTAEGYLYLEYAFHKIGIFALSDGEAEALLAANRGSWEIVEKDGIRCLKIPYELRIPRKTDEADVIRVIDSADHYVNFTTVTLWDLHEYHGTLPDMPLPSFIGLNRAWEWKPLAASPTLYKTVLGFAGHGHDVNQYEQWPEITWTEATYREMAAVIHDFTTSDSAEWYNAAHRMPRDPIVGIEAVRRLCWPVYEPREIAPRRDLGRTPRPFALG